MSGVQSRLAAVRAAEARLDELYSLPGEAPGQPAREDDVFRAIVFENVTFSYEGEEQPVLRNFSARLPLDRWTCLTGMSGSGKSTLFRLILGLYHPQQGRVYLETERGELPCSAAVRGLFGYVPQTPWLFSGSIRENLLLAKPEADDAALWEVLERAQCGFVRDLPDRLETVLSEEGGGLSAGQRQRLAIARALATDARAYLFDDSFSALDYKTDARLREELAKNVTDAALVVVAQRIATIMHADQIIVLDDGHVVGTGTHEELLHSCPAYLEIAQSQLSAEELGLTQEEIAAVMEGGER